MQFYAPHFRHPNHNGRVLADKRMCAQQIDNAIEVVMWCRNYYFDFRDQPDTQEACQNLRYWQERLRRLCPRTRWPVYRIERGQSHV